MLKLFAVVALVLALLVPIVPVAASEPGGGGGGGGGPVVLPPPPIPPFPPAIVGQVVDAKTGKALPSQSYPYTYIVLTRLDDFGNRVGIVYTDCWSRFEACADENGKFLITSTYDDLRLPPGPCLLEVNAFTYVLRRIPLTCGGELVDLGEIKLASQPIELAIIEWPALIPSAGGELRWGYTLRNPTRKRVTVEVTGIVSGPGVIDSWAQGLAERRKLQLVPESEVFIHGAGIQIPGQIPDGYMFCLDLAVRPAGKVLFGELAQTYQCVRKGDPLPVPPSPPCDEKGCG